MGSSHDTLDAGQHLSRAEGLADIVIRAHVEAGDDAVFIAGSCNENNRNIRLLCFDRRTYGIPVSIGKGNIDKRQIKGFILDLRHRCRLTRCPDHIESFGF